MNLGGGQCYLGSLTGAVSSILGRSNGDVRDELGYMLENPSPQVVVKHESVTDGTEGV